MVVVLTLLVLSCKNETKKANVNNHENHVASSENDEVPKNIVLSPHKFTMEMIGNAHIHIDYSSPGVRGRVIFGGLVSYENVWQTGAHNATWIETNKDLVIKSMKCTNSEFDDNPEIIAYIQVRDLTKNDNDKVFVFNGWMFSSSPSIAPFDHAVYDIWLVNCY